MLNPQALKHVYPERRGFQPQVEGLVTMRYPRSLKPMVVAFVCLALLAACGEASKPAETAKPIGSGLKEPVLYRLRMREDPDDDGVDQVVITDWYALYGDGEDWLPAPDEWLPLWDSPLATASDGETPPPAAFYTPFDEAGATVVELIEEVISAKLAAPEGRHTIHAAIFNINDPRITD